MAGLHETLKKVQSLYEAMIGSTERTERVV